MDRLKSEYNSIYDYLFLETASRNTINYPLMKDPFQGLLILKVWILLYAKIIPTILKNRQPVPHRRILLIYNVLQIVLNTALLCESLAAGWIGRYNYFCEPIDRTQSPTAKRTARFMYFYLLLKLLDFFDTISLALQKKQISYLQMYHHSVMAIVCWGMAKWWPGGQLSVVVPVNCFIHVVMYTYYLLSLLGPQFKKYLWWKQYLTLAQMVQFGFFMLQTIVHLYTNCPHDKVVQIISGLNASIIFCLFTNYYIKTYIAGSKTLKKN